MLKLKINNTEIEVEEGLTVLQACEKIGVEIPRFCYHERLSIAGNCRMCLVEMEKSPKPIASCAIMAIEGMNIKTNTPLVEKSRKLIAQYLKCKPSEIVFTSGGTESNNIALIGTLEKGNHFITSSYEHPDILNVAKNLEKNVIEVSYIKPNKSGVVCKEDIEK